MTLRRTAFLVTSISAAILALVVVLVFVPTTRALILRGTAQTLVAHDSVTSRADVVVVAVDAGPAGLMEAADLVRAQVSPSVAVFLSPPGKVNLELRARGVPVEDREALARRQLESLGVQSIVPIPPVVGTEDQGRVLPGWCRENGFDTVVVVTSWHHARRTQRVLQRAIAGQPVRLTIQVARHADFEPEDWWQSRDGLRTVLVEVEKLAVDALRHPFS